MPAALPALQPFQAKVQIQLPPGQCCDNAFVDVPAGKLLVIEYASAWAFANGNQTFQLEGARLALTANIVTAAVQEASIRAQIKDTREIIDAQQIGLAHRRRFLSDREVHRAMYSSQAE